MTAPGILPVAISLRIYSPTRSNFAREKPAGTDGDDSARPAFGRPTATARTRSASAAATLRRRAKPSVLHRFIDQLLRRPLDALTLRGRLLQQHEKHVLLAVDHEITATSAVPFQFAQRARRRRLCIPRIGANRETETEAEAIAGEIEVVAPDAGTRAYLICRHQFEGFGAQI